MSFDLHTSLYFLSYVFFKLLVENVPPYHTCIPHLRTTGFVISYHFLLIENGEVKCGSFLLLLQQLSHYTVPPIPLGLGGAELKNLPDHARDMGVIPGSGNSPGEGNGNPLQHSCLKNPMHRGAWQTAVLGVIESDTVEPACTGHWAPSPSSSPA